MCAGSCQPWRRTMSAAGRQHAARSSTQQKNPHSKHQMMRPVRRRPFPSGGGLSFLTNAKLRKELHHWTEFLVFYVLFSRNKQQQGKMHTNPKSSSPPPPWSVCHYSLFLFFFSPPPRSPKSTVSEQRNILCQCAEMSLDEVIRQEIKQNDATVVSGRDNLDHKRHGAKKEEETNEEKNSEKRKKKKWHFPRAQRRYVSNKAPKIDGENHATTSGKCDKLAGAHQLSLPPLSLSSLRGSRRKEKEDSAKRFPYRNGYENAILQTVMWWIRHGISWRNGQNALHITQPPVLSSYPIIPFHNNFCNFSKTITI